MKRFAQPSPGPWWLRAGNGCVQVSDGPTIDKVIAIVTTCDSVGVANARLICAAPDLLAALESMLEAYAPRAQETVDAAKGNENVLHSAVRSARAAIAKSEGVPDGWRSNPDWVALSAPDPVAILRRVLRWYRETTDGEMPPELHDDVCRAVGEEVGE